MGEPLSKLADFGRAMADAQDEQLRRVELSTAERLLAEPAAAPRGSSRRVAILSLAAAAAALVVLALWPRALTFAVGDGDEVGQVDEWTAAPADGVVPLRFSDGTSLVLGAKARARVTAADPHGAKLVVERGQVEARVVPREGASWRLLFGPYEVRVTGTRFVADWSPESQRLTVDLTEGSVVVRGPALDEGHRLTAGNQLEVSAIERRATIRSNRPTAKSPEETEPPPPEPAASQDEPSEPDPVPTASAATSTTSTPPRVARWRALYEAGKYKPALAAAKSQGFESLCAEAGAAELMMLAETARYGGEPTLAARALA
ncbi:MAG: FecR domain-containing protein, partial [Deltaproteobacteria bacterium]|nr:FecR domain-containing protein [Deltaproteobacteria bacterium]MBW2532325.1 FecR domain-containing protein [Deltaproteobacteria bacterium]